MLDTKLSSFIPANRHQLLTQISSSFLYPIFESYLSLLPPEYGLVQPDTYVNSYPHHHYFHHLCVVPRYSYSSQLPDDVSDALSPDLSLQLPPSFFSTSTLFLTLPFFPSRSVHYSTTIPKHLTISELFYDLVVKYSVIV